MRPSKAMLVVAVSISIGALSAFGYSLSPHSQLKRPSLGYWLLANPPVKSIVANFPDAVFAYTPADGPSPEVQQLRIDNIDNEAKEKVVRELAIAGFTHNGHEWERRQERVDLEMTSPNQLIVTFTIY